jgi:hypothetical protein
MSNAVLENNSIIGGEIKLKQEDRRKDWIQRHRRKFRDGIESQNESVYLAQFEAETVTMIVAKLPDHPPRSANMKATHARFLTYLP